MGLEIKNLSFGYGKRQKVLVDVSAEFGDGMHLLLGPNGAGKTTLLKVIAGLLRPRAGECVYGKEATVYHSPHTMKDLFLLQDECKFPLNTINDMVKRHAPFYPDFSADFLAMALSSFEMTGNEKLSGLSLGNRHKAQVAYALALNTKVLLLDEPANGLDITSKKALATLLSRAMDTNEGKCIIIATHTVHEMRNLFDTVTILNHGTVVLNASLAHISARLAFVGGCRQDNALCYEPSVNGPAQIVPNVDEMETPVDFNLLFTVAVGDNSSQLKSLLS